jgi:hypothetical protein
MVEMVDEMVEEGAGGQLYGRLRALVTQQRHRHVLQQLTRGRPRLRLFLLKGKCHKISWRLIEESAEAAKQ